MGLSQRKLCERVTDETVKVADGLWYSARAERTSTKVAKGCCGQKRLSTQTTRLLAIKAELKTAVDETLCDNY